MVKKFVALFAIITIIVILWLAFGVNNNTATAPTATSTPAQTTPVAANSNKVVIKDFAFNPSDIDIKKGTTVTWTNQDSTAHQPTENDGQTGPISPVLNQGQTYSFQYNQTGTFHYHCSIHPEMTGTVTVKD